MSHPLRASSTTERGWGGGGGGIVQAPGSVGLKM